MLDRGNAISVRNLSKRFTITQNARRRTTLTDEITSTLRNLYRKQEREKAVAAPFWALKDVNFDINWGDVVGVIGRNGSGKSTLLKILSRIVDPTDGRVELHGRVGSLLEVGTGFHPELTGRENIYLNGTVLGLSQREVRRRFDEIVDFAEVEQFLDTPVKRYSSGMYMRLAFSVAAHLDPEILLVDEVLAVGDLQFQNKCLGKMEEVSQRGGRAILLVSHHIAPIQKLCNRLIVMSHGEITYQGPVMEGVSHYMEMLSSGSRAELVDWEGREATNPSGFIRFTGLNLIHVTPTLQSEFMIGEQIGLSISVYSASDVSGINIGYTILDNYGTAVFTSHHDDTLALSSLQRGETTFETWINPNYLQPGRYTVTIGAFVNNVGQDFVTGAAQIQIVPVLGTENAKLDFRPGIVRMDFPWMVKEFHGGN